MMSPGAGIGEHIHGNCEEIFFCLDENAHADFVYNGRKAQVPGPACVPCRAGDSHGIFNSSDKARPDSPRSVFTAWCSPANAIAADSLTSAPLPPARSFKAIQVVQHQLLHARPKL